MPIAYDQNVNLHISTTAEGGGEVTDLANRIDALGKEAGAAQPQFQELAAALRKAGQEQGALGAFRDAKLSVGRLKNEMDAAVGSVDKLAAELNSAKSATGSAAAANQAATERLAQAKAKYEDYTVSLRHARDELQILRTASKEAGADSAAYAAHIGVLKETIESYRKSQAGARAEVQAERDAQKAAALAVKELASAERELETQYSRSVAAAGKVSTALHDEQVRLDAARAVLNAAGIDTTKLSDAQARLASQVQKTKDAAAGLEQRYAAVGTSARTAGRSMESDFAAVGIRSTATIRSEILGINQSLGRLAMSARVSGEEFNRAYAVGQARIAELTAEMRLAEAASAGIGRGLTASMGMAAAATGPVLAALAALSAGAEFVRVNVAMESLDRSLTQITGSGLKAREEIEWLKETTNRLGIETISAARSYVGLTAAAKGTSLEGEATRRIYTAVAGSMAMLGKSSAETEGAIQAVSQMISKGTVSMEEMRQQLAERLPGAMQATADAAGLSVSELTQMIGSGQVLAEDLLPRLADGLEKMYGTGKRVDGFEAGWARLKNSVSETMTFIGDTGVWTALTDIVELGAGAVRRLTAAFDLAGKSIGITSAAINSFDFRHPINSVLTWKDAIAEAAYESEKKLNKVKASLDKTAESHGHMATAAKASANTQEASWLAVVQAYSKVGKAATEQAVLAQKSAAARAEEGKAATDLANALGSETEKRDVSLRASTANAEALQQLAQARRVEAEVAKSNAIALAEAAKGETALSDAKRKAIQDATDAAAAKEQEARQAEAAAQAANVHVAALEVEKAAIQDNAGRVIELKTAMETATAALTAMQAAQAAGVVPDKEVQAAQIEAAKASAMYRDALHDQTAAIESNARIKAAQVSVEGAGIRLAIEQQRSIMEVARARGDEYTAIQAGLEIKRLEIKLAELNAKAKAAEADAAMLGVKAKREELTASGQLTPAKEAELKAQEAAAQVKKVEGQIASETAGRMKELFEQTRMGAQAAVMGADDYEQLAGSIRRVGDAAGDAGIRVASLGRTSAPLGVLDRNGQQVTDGTSLLDQGSQQGRDLDWVRQLYQRGATIEEAKLAQKYVGELYARNQSTMLSGNLGTSANYVRLANLAASDAVEKALQLARQEQTTGQAVDLGPAVSDLIAQRMAQSQTKAYSWEAAARTQGDIVKAAGNEAQRAVQERIYRVQIGDGVDRVSLTADNEDDARKFIKNLETQMKRVS